MAKRASSRRWCAEHAACEFVRRAKQDGYRSRAAYKLLEIQERDRLIRPAMTVIDLGASPGGWSQVASRLVGGSGNIIATDLITMEPLTGVRFVPGDFTEDLILEDLDNALKDVRPDLVLSDMSPNISGVRAVDQPRAMYLAELVLDFALKILAPGGDLVVKIFQGEGVDPYLKALDGHFARVMVRKPKASRGRSRECYAVARGLR